MELLFKQIQASKGSIDELLCTLGAYNITQDGRDAPFDDARDLFESIDAILYGDTPWETFTVRYAGPTNEDSPLWKRADYIINCHNARKVIHNMFGTKEFNSKFDITPYQEYLPNGSVCYSNMMSGEHAYKQAVCLIHSC